MTSDLPMLRISESGARPKYFKFEAQRSDRATVRQLALQLANYYLGGDRSRTQWASVREKFTCKWEGLEKTGTEGKTHWVPHESAPLQLKDFERVLLHNGELDYEQKGLPEPTCPWLDAHIPISQDYHFSDNTGSVSIRVPTSLGSKFPLHPMIDREGVIINSFQPILLERMHSLRAWLVDRSDDPAKSEWFQAFRTLTTECISFVDNTLHQLYFKAQYDPEPGWTFSASALGERHGRKLNDKLGWVHRITGQHLNAEHEVRSMNVIRELRNHLQHFDPPCFACTWEEAAEWLNHVINVARLGWRIRTCASATPSPQLIRLLLQPRVIFVPADPAKRRSPQPKDVGYGSSSASALASGATRRLGPAIVDLQSLVAISRIIPQN